MESPAQPAREPDFLGHPRHQNLRPGLIFFSVSFKRKKENPCHISDKGILELEVIDDIV